MTILIFLQHLLRFFKRLPKWIKLCWQQENWDYEYLYDLIDMKLNEFLVAQQEDTIHLPKETKRRVKQIKICLNYLHRFRNWTEYYDYPIEDIYFDNNRLKYTSKYNELKRYHVHAYIKFNYDMFWKRFLQWHQGWWT